MTIIVGDSMGYDSNELEDRVDFDSWYAMRKAKIPSVHHKEIIKADFNGQGLPETVTIDAFDAALKKYGVDISNV